MVEYSLSRYRAGQFCDPIGVWGAFGAGKTQFLFWAAEVSLQSGLLPVYLHLNDLFAGLPDGSSPDDFRDHARTFVATVVENWRTSPDSAFLRQMYRDEALLSFISKGRDKFDLSDKCRLVLLVDEVEQAYISLRGKVRADDRSPLRAWLEDGTFKVCAFAVGSLYVLGGADRERLKIYPIPAVRPSNAKEVLSDLPEATINALWWLSRGKPRHLMKAAQRYRTFKPETAIEIHGFVNELDSVSQAPYDTESHNVVPACYVDQLQPNELRQLLSLRPLNGEGDGKLFPITSELESELLSVVRDAFKMEGVAVHLVRYIVMLLEATAVNGFFALRESDTPYLLRLAVDFLLEYERERLEKDSSEEGAALKKLLEAHDSAEAHAGQIFWKLQGKLKATETAIPSLSFAAIAASFPLPTTSPTLIGTNPGEVRRRYEDSKQPVFLWRDSAGNAVVFLTSTGALSDYSDTSEFRQYALSPTTGVIALLPFDADDWRPSGFTEWLNENSRLRVSRLPLPLTDFLLSLRDSSNDGTDPFPIAALAEADKNLQRQVSFYRSRLHAFVADAISRPRPVVPLDVPKPLSQILGRLADKDSVALAVRQAFETMSPQVNGFLVDLRDLVTNSKLLWGRSGLISLADDLLPHRSARSNRIDPARMIDDIRREFSAYLDSLRRLAAFVICDEIEYLTDDQACKIALRSLWQSKRGDGVVSGDDLARYNAQVGDFVATLKATTAVESALTKLGIRPTFGTIGELMNILPYIEKLARDTTTLLTTSGGADRRLAILLFQQFLAAFVEAIEGDVAKMKVTVSNVKTSLSELRESRKRVTAAARSPAATFAGLDTKSVGSLLDTLQKECQDSLKSEPTVQDTA